MASKNYANPTAKSDARIAEAHNRNIQSAHERFARPAQTQPMHTQPQHAVNPNGRPINIASPATAGSNKKILAIIIAAIVVIGLLVLIIPTMCTGPSKPVADLTQSGIETTSSSSSSAYTDSSVKSDTAQLVLGTWSADGVSLTLKSDGTGIITTTAQADLTWSVEESDILLTNTEGKTQRANYNSISNYIEISGVKLTRASSGSATPPATETKPKTEDTITTAPVETTASIDGIYTMTLQTSNDPAYNVKDYDGITLVLAEDSTATINKGQTPYASGIKWTKDDSGQVVLSGLDQMTVNVPNNFIYMIKNESETQQKLTEKNNEMFLSIDDDQIVIALKKA